MTLSELIDDLILIRANYPDLTDAPVTMADGLDVTEVLVFEDGVVISDDINE
jgi:hypothetical protein